MGIKDISSFDFIDWPSDLLFSQAFKQLKLLKSIDPTGFLTPLGLEMSILPTDPIFSYLLLHSL